MLFGSNKEIGNAGLSVAIAYFGANGYTVSIPLNDTQDYDLIVDKDGQLKKVQIKSTGYLVRANTYQLQLRSVSGTSRKVYKTVKDTDVDLIFALCEDRTMYLIPIDDLDNCNAINLAKEKSKYAKKSTKDYSKYIVNL